MRKIRLKSIILSAGGTGGHLFPAIATGEELIKHGYQAHLITDKRCQKYLSPDLKLIVHIIDSRINQQGVLGKLWSAVIMLAATCKAILLLRKTRPSIIVGFGGYPSVPPLIASLFLGIPIVIHEQNCFLGKSNKFFMRFAKKLALSYEETRNINYQSFSKSNIIITGDIVRESIKNLKVKSNFDNPIFRIFIFGGSQSAKIFSSLVPESINIIIKARPEIKLQIVQQVLAVDHKEVSRSYTALGVPHQLSEFFHNMAELYENSELVISRSGASTIAELTSIGQPAIFIPYPLAVDNHQFYNAKALEEAGAGWCYEQYNLTSGILAAKIIELIDNRHLLMQASKNLLKRKSDGGTILANTVEKIIS